MEKEGLIRAVKVLHDEQLTIKQLVTDRHPQIQKYVRENLKETDHKYDVWHIVKGKFPKIFLSYEEINYKR